TYPFQRRRYWFAPDGAKAASAQSELPFSARVLRTPRGEAYWEGRLEGEREQGLMDHRVRGTSLLPAVATFDLMLTAAASALGAGPWTLCDVRLDAPV